MDFDYEPIEDDSFERLMDLQDKARWQWEHDQVEKVRERDARIAELEAELAPWREMARQLEELRGEGLVFSINDTGDEWQVLIHLYTGTEVTDASGVDDLWTRFQGEDEDLPAAVAAAYGKVVGDE